MTRKVTKQDHLNYVNDMISKIDNLLATNNISKRGGMRRDKKYRKQKKEFMRLKKIIEELSI